MKGAKELKEQARDKHKNGLQNLSLEEGMREFEGGEKMDGVKKWYDPRTEDFRLVSQLFGKGNRRNVLERYEG